MFVITADQVDSRGTADRTEAAAARLDARFGDRLALPVDRTAGDELQALTADATTALDVVLDLAREGGWSIGLGIGGVRTPLPEATRLATGDAFVAARAAVDVAKQQDARAAVRVGPDARTPDAEAFLRLLLAARARRSPEGWAAADLVDAGLPQKDAAARLGVSAQAVSARLRAAGWAADRDARPALARLLAAEDAS